MAVVMSECTGACAVAAVLESPQVPGWGPQCCIRVVPPLPRVHRDRMYFAEGLGGCT